MIHVIRALALTTTMLAVPALADTLELADGSLFEGDFVGSSNGVVMFNTGTGIEAFPEDEVVGIYLSSGVKTKQEEMAKETQPAKPAAPTTATIPSGTRLVIRMADSIDSKRHQVGHRFRGQLEGAIVINGATVAPRGTFVHGRISEAKSGGRAVGSAEMAIIFTDIMIDDQLYEIETTGMKAQTGNEAAKTAGRTARAAAIGGLAKGSKGAKNMAKVGLGASILTSGATINVPAGTVVETDLRADLTVPL